MFVNASRWNIPPVEKIYEALSAIADGRVRINGNEAVVTSSDYKKEYIVKWDGNIYSSNDNASYWQGVIGYPVIAVLMLQDRIKYDATEVMYFKGINWKDLNRIYKRNYNEAVNFVLNKLSRANVDIDLIIADINKIYNQIEELDLNRKRSHISPPK